MSDVPSIDGQGELAVGLYTNATMHTPIKVTREALAKAKELEVDCVVSLSSFVILFGL